MRKKKGLIGIALTDHADPSNLDFVLERLRRAVSEINPHHRIRALAGVELTHVPPALIAPLTRRARELGAQVVVVHGETIVEPVPTGTNLAAIEAGVDVLAHPGLLTPAQAKLAAEKGEDVHAGLDGGQVCPSRNQLDDGLAVDDDHLRTELPRPPCQGGDESRRNVGELFDTARAPDSVVRVDLRDGAPQPLQHEVEVAGVGVVRERDADEAPLFRTLDQLGGTHRAVAEERVRVQVNHRPTASPAAASSCAPAWTSATASAICSMSAGFARSTWWRRCTTCACRPPRRRDSAHDDLAVVLERLRRQGALQVLGPKTSDGDRREPRRQARRGCPPLPAREPAGPVALRRNARIVAQQVVVVAVLRVAAVAPYVLDAAHLSQPPRQEAFSLALRILAGELLELAQEHRALQLGEAMDPDSLCETRLLEQLPRDRPPLRSVRRRDMRWPSPPAPASSVASSPPSPEVMVLFDWKLKEPKSPRRRSAGPSSERRSPGRSPPRGQLMISGERTQRVHVRHLPARCTGMIARVRSVIRRAQSLRVEAITAWVDVGEHRHGPDHERAEVAVETKV